MIKILLFILFTLILWSCSQNYINNDIKNTQSAFILNNTNHILELKDKELWIICYWMKADWWQIYDWADSISCVKNWKITVDIKTLLKTMDNFYIWTYNNNNNINISRVLNKNDNIVCYAIEWNALSCLNYLDK